MTHDPQQGPGAAEAGEPWAPPEPWPAPEPFAPAQPETVPVSEPPSGDEVAATGEVPAAGSVPQGSVGQHAQAHGEPGMPGWPPPQGQAHGGPPQWGAPQGTPGAPHVPGWPQPGLRPPVGHTPRPVSYPAPVRFEQVPGEGFGLAILPAPGAVSGVGVGSLVTGVGSILVSAAVWCFGLLGTGGGWGALVAGAFVVLSVLLGVAGVVLGILSLRQIKRARSVAMTGRGYAISGIACGAVGVLLATSGLAAAIALS